MAFQGNFRCEYCHRSNFLSSRGLTQHLERSRICGLAFERAATHNFSSSSSDEGNESLEPDSSDQSMEMNNIPPEIELPFHDLDAITAQLGAFLMTILTMRPLNFIQAIAMKTRLHHPKNRRQVKRSPQVQGIDKRKYWTRHMDS